MPALRQVLVLRGLGLLWARVRQLQQELRQQKLRQVLRQQEPRRQLLGQQRQQKLRVRAQTNCIPRTRRHSGLAVGIPRYTCAF